MRKFLKRSTTFVLALAMLLSCALILDMPKSTTVEAATSIPAPDTIKAEFAANGTGTNTALNHALVASQEKMLTVKDPASGKYFVRSGTSEGYGFFYTPNALDSWTNKIDTKYTNGGTADCSLTWELLVRVPNMATTESYVDASGFISGGWGFGLYINNTKGCLRFVDADETQVNFTFDMVANQWYHLVLRYNDTTNKVSAFVNGTSIKIGELTEVTVSRPTYGYVSGKGVSIGGRSPEYLILATPVTVPALAQDVGVCNVWQQSLSDDVVAAMYSEVESTWLKLVPDIFEASFDNAGGTDKVTSATLAASNDNILTKKDPISGQYYLSTNTTTNGFLRTPTNVGGWGSSALIRDSFTWETLIRIPSMPTSTTYVDAQGACHGGPRDAFGFLVNNKHGMLRVGTDTANIPSADHAVHEFVFGMQANQWYHLVLTYDASANVLRAYVNGKAIAINGETSISVTGSPKTHYLWAGKTMSIGGINNVESAATLPSVGQDVGIYNLYRQKMTDAEVKNCYTKVSDTWIQPKADYAQVEFRKDGTGVNLVNNTALTASSGEVAPVTVFDPVSQKYYLSTNKEDATSFFMIPSFTSWKVDLDNKYNNKSDPNLDCSLSWEYMFRLPSMPDGSALPIGGYMATGGFGLYANHQSQAWIRFISGKGKVATEGEYYIHDLIFDIELQEWNHLVVSYDDMTKKVSIYINGQLATFTEKVTLKEDSSIVRENANVTEATIDYISSPWTHGDISIGGTGSFYNAASMYVPQDVAICNVYSQPFTQTQITRLYSDIPTTYSPESKVYSVQPNLKESIQVNYAVAIQNSVLGEATPTIKYTFKDDTIEVTGTKIGGDAQFSHWNFPLEDILPQDMCENIAAEVYVGDQVIQTKDTYSMKEYCMNMLNKPEYAGDEWAEFRALLVAILNYGAESQKYFEAETDSSKLANADLNETQKGYLTNQDMSTATGVVSSPVQGTADANYTWKGATLGLYDYIRVRLKFTVADIESAQIKIGDKVYTKADFLSAGGGAYYLYTDGIVPTNFATPITAIFWDGAAQVGQSVQYSVNTYVSYVNGLGTNEVTPIVQAIYNYGMAASAFVA